jgi:hypothetical protein
MGKKYVVLAFDPTVHTPGNVPAGVVPFVMPDLDTLSMAAIRSLSTDPDGFFLLVEGASVDSAAHANNVPQLVEEMLAFNRAVGAVIDWVESESSWSETLLIVTTDHANGLFLGPDSDVIPFQDPVAGAARQYVRKPPGKGPLGGRREGLRGIRRGPEDGQQGLRLGEALGRDGEPSVLAFVVAVDRAEPEAVDPALGRRGPSLPGHDLSQLEGQALGQQAGDDLLPLPGPASGVECRDDAEGDNAGRGHVIDGNGVQDRLSVAALGGHHAPLGLEKGIEARQGRPGSRVAVGVDRAGDDPRVDLAQGLVVHAQPLAHAETVVVEHHV